MENIIIGIDVSKDRLDVAVRPSGEVFVIGRNPAELERLALRLGALSPNLVRCKPPAALRPSSRPRWLRHGFQ